MHSNETYVDPFPPLQSVRRTLRARPEDYISSGNSVNPSPKKQPRLNIPSPTDAAKQWNNMVGDPTGESAGQLDDESLCKRYKLEDQLSDIQFIDCNTPEHTVIGSGGGGAGGDSTTSSTAVLNTIFTSAQVHSAPQDEPDEQNQESIGEMIGLRNSYPGTQYGQSKYDTSPIKETRFSYPGSGVKGGNKDAPQQSTSANAAAKVQSMNVDEQTTSGTGMPVLKKNESSLYER